MKKQDPSHFVVVPPDFGEEVERAASGKQLGDLGLLAAEVRGLDWELEGLRTVGRAQFGLKDYEEAKSTWEAVRQLAQDDPEASLLLATIRERLGDPSGSTQARECERILIFTGHMIDDPRREKPRFPADKEDAARRKIKEAVEGEMKTGAGVAFGIAGGASGGDILFHEVCAELGIPTRLYLAMPPGLYVTKSVQKAGPRWVERFRQLHARLSAQKAVRVLSEVDDEPEEEDEYLPVWLRSKPDYNIWQRVNLWMLHNALTAGGDDCITLIALWDQAPSGDGAGGTGDLVQRARARGARTIILDTRQLFGL
ncbi:MAG TPA: hypothetical protein VM934_12900 [Pyrinomonadaceae bacterium]|nr:hypothetical protein [Pyrinomonadaceae bacterium]